MRGQEGWRGVEGEGGEEKSSWRNEEVMKAMAVEFQQL